MKHASKAEQAALLKEFMKVNNEFANLQRELTKKNTLLERERKQLKDLIAFNQDSQIVYSDAQVLFMNPMAKQTFALTAEDLSRILPVIAEEGEVHIVAGGVERYLEVKSTEIQWEGAEATLLSLRDVTARKFVEIEKEKSDKLKGVLEMAGAAAHEFSQPLQSLGMDIEYLVHRLNAAEPDGEEDTDIQESKQSIRDNMKRLTSIVSQVQNIKRYETMEYLADSKIIDLDKASTDDSDKTSG